MTDDKDPEELLAQSKEQKRHTSEPSSPEDGEGPSLEQEIANYYQAIDDGEVPHNLTMRDESLAALMRALESTGQLDDLGADVRDRLDRTPRDDESRGPVLAMLVRVGLQEVRPDLLESGKSGFKIYQQNQDIEF
ncbi:hypothetical protein [Haloarcula brevis]|uniref:hypothetical protein n=1 Tax=Haloarcula brevis TaxID=3111453 RepID=UPI00300EAC6D